MDELAPSTVGSLESLQRHGGQVVDRTVDFLQRMFKRRSSSMDSSRHHSVSARPKKTSSAAAPNEVPSSSISLNETQKVLLARTWNDDFDFLYQLGSDIYTYIFEQCPTARTLFPAVAKYGDDWKGSSEFRTQALRFVQVLAHAIQQLNRSEAKLDLYLYQIGRAHCKYAVRGFEPNFWGIFEGAIATSMTERVNNIASFCEAEKKDAIVAWNLLAVFVVVKMKKGYMEGMEQRTKQIKSGQFPRD